MICIYLASFLEKENFGPGSIVSICNGNKPKDIKVTQQFKYFIPTQDIINTYYDLAPKEPERASKIFVSGYQKQLENFLNLTQEEAISENISLTDLLPFKDGDTLCSWERFKYNNYRKILAPYLEKFGYEVVLH